MTERVIGSKGSRRRKRWALFGPLALVLALILPAIVSASALPPTGSTNTFEFDGNLRVQSTSPGNLDWAPYLAPDSGSDVAVIKDVARTIPTGNNKSDCTATSTSSSLYKPADPNVTPTAPLAPFVLGDGGFGQGVIVCDGTISKQTPSDTNGYVQGGHEDQGQNPVQWNIAAASSPKKTDLSEVYTYGMLFDSPFDANATKDNLLMVFDAGRLDTNGDFHVDFEMNQKKITDCNDAATDTKLSTVCQPRTPGDVLVSYDSAGGGQPPTATVFEWEHPPTTGTTCASSQGTDASLTDGGCYVLLTNPPAIGGFQAAQGVFNTAEIPAAPWRAVVCDNTSIQSSSQCTLRDVIAPNGNMEGYIDITGFVNDFNLCPGFGEITARSRSSSGINASLQDTTGAIPVNASVCGSIIVKKEKADHSALPGATFTFSPDPSTRDANSSLAVADDGVDANDHADASNGYVCIDQVLFGSYDITETGVPTGYFGDSSTKTVSVSDPSTCKDRLDANGVPKSASDINATFTNNLGSLLIKKLQRNADGSTSLLGGATFTVSPDPTVGQTGGTKDVTDKTDGTGGDTSIAAGVVCIDNVQNLGAGNDYTITEKTPPSGFFGDSSSITQGVHSASSCADRLNADGTIKDPQPVGVSTTLAAASAALATNIKVASVAGMFVGQTLVIGGANQESGVISAVGTATATGTGVTLTAGLSNAHASGVAVTSSAIASFTNVKGSLLIKKVAKDKSCTAAGKRVTAGDAPDCLAAGTALYGSTGKFATFKITPSPTSSATNLLVTDNGTGDANSTGGYICIDNVADPGTGGSYAITEDSSGNSNYSKDTSTATVLRANISNQLCSARSTTSGFDGTFTNIPLSKIEVLFTSSAGTGVTSAVITCKNAAGTTIDPDTGGTTGIDQSYSGLLPNPNLTTNYTCTVNIDP